MGERIKDRIGKHRIGKRADKDRDRVRKRID